MADGDDGGSSGGWLKGLQDPYERYARLAPGLVAVIPVAVVLMAIPTGDQSWLKPVVGVVAACGGTILVAAVARSAGRAVQDSLFPDGLPTLQRMRHRQATTRVELAELHAAVSAATGVELPDAETEAADPEEADGVYRIAIGRLIGATRDQERFALLHKENRNYGFMRNLYGLRPIGRVLASVGVVGGVVLLVVALTGGGGLDVGLAVVAVLVGLAGVYVFAVWMTPDRVTAPATAYADRLFEAARTLAG